MVMEADYKDIWERFGPGWENERQLTWSDFGGRQVFVRVTCGQPGHHTVEGRVPWDLGREPHLADAIQMLRNEWNKEKRCQCAAKE